MLRSLLLNLNQNSLSPSTFSTPSPRRKKLMGKVMELCCLSPLDSLLSALSMIVTWYLSPYTLTISWIIQIGCKVLKSSTKIVYASVAQVPEAVWVSNIGDSFRYFFKAHCGWLFEWIRLSSYLMPCGIGRLAKFSSCEIILLPSLFFWSHLRICESHYTRIKRTSNRDKASHFC